MPAQTFATESEYREDPRLEFIMVVLLIAILSAITFAHFSELKPANSSKQPEPLTIVQSNEIPEWL